MRTLLLTTAVALCFCTSAQAQDKSSTTTPATHEADPLMGQKRELSGALKTTLGTAYFLLKKASEKDATAKTEGRESEVAVTDGIKTIQTSLNEQLSAVNSATAQEATFAHAREVNESSRKTLEGYAKALGVELPDAKGNIAKKPVSK